MQTSLASKRVAVPRPKKRNKNPQKVGIHSLLLTFKPKVVLDNGIIAKSKRSTLPF